MSAQPLISIIIPVFNVADSLSDCLDSITRQKFDDFEIVAVDGKSEDESDVILDERSLIEPRLTIAHRARIGPGNARNEGIRLASGKYIWFVDGDDRITADSLSVIAERIEECEPDVLLVGHEVIYANGRSEPGYGHEQMHRSSPLCFTLSQQPWVVDLSMASWNKVFRRELILSSAAGFSSTWPHEDVLFSCRMLLDARSLSCLRHICYLYNKNRTGSAMDVAGRKHFNIFNAYEQVLDLVETRIRAGDESITPSLHRAFFERAIWHYSTILETGGALAGAGRTKRLVVGKDRREFFRRICEDFRRYKPEEYYIVGSGPRSWKFRLIASERYCLYRVLEPVNRARVRIAGFARPTHRRSSLPRI